MGPVFWGKVGTFLYAVFIGGGTYSGWYAFAVQVARIAIVSLAAKALAPKNDLSNAAREKLLTIRDPIAPQTFIYGEDMVSGPIVYGNVAGFDNEDLWLAIAFAGHEVDSILGYRLDDIDVDLTDLSGAEDGTVDSGHFTDVAEVFVRKGTSTQTWVSELGTAYVGWTSAHRGRGWAYMIWHWWLVKKDTTYESGAPQNIRAIVRGYKLYDPRLDSTNGGTGPHRLADDTTWEWSHNPALCLAHFLTDSRFGIQESDTRIDWAKIITAADICEELVSIPGAATQERYTCNATFQSTERRGTVRDVLLAAMLGRMVFSQGKWLIWAGAAITPDVTLTESNLGAGISLQASAGAKERYNRVRGKFIDPSRSYTAATYPEVRSSTYVTEDGGEVRPLTVDWTSCNNEYEAQRNAIVTLKQSRQQRLAVFEGNMSCFRIQPGTTVFLDVAEFGFTGEKFFVSEWILTDDGVQLTMIEEIDSSWDAPAPGEYTTRTATGALVFANQGVPPPTSPAIQSIVGGVFISWTSPPEYMHAHIEVWGSDDNVRANALLVATIKGEQALDQISDDRTRFYWLRSVNEYGTESLYEPNLTTTTLIGQRVNNSTSSNVPDFSPGFIGGASDFIYTLNEDLVGADDGELKIDGTQFIHPDGTQITPDIDPWSLNTFYEGTETGQFYIMFSATIAETRFGGVAADWGTGDDTRFLTVTWNSVDLWRARSGLGTYYALTPVATDCIIAVCDKLAASGGITSLVPFTSGIRGTDGLSVYVASVYQRAASPPATPTVDDGSYNFGTSTLTPPSGWSTTPPAADGNPLYVSTGNFSIIGTTGTDSSVTWTATAELVTDGVDGSPGNDGTVIKVGQVYLRKGSAPSTPVTDDGSYNFATLVLTPPSTGGGSADDWSITVPAGSDPLYVSNATFEAAIGGTDNTCVWTSPAVLVQDGDPGLSVFVGNVYLRSASAPATPTVNSGQYNFTTLVLTPPSSPVQWFVEPPAGSNPLYVSSGAFSIAGQTGIDTSVTWSAPDLLVQDGATGAAGDDGLSVYVANAYKRSITAPSTPTVNDGEYNFTTKVLTPPSTWSVTPPDVDGNPLWVTTGSFSVPGQTGTDTTVVWTSPDKMVEDGAAGGEGNFRDIKFKRATTQPATPTGDNPAGWVDEVPAGTDTLWSITGTKTSAGALQGAWSTPERVGGMAYRGAWVTGVDYILHDIVLFNERTYICVQLHTSLTTTREPSGSNSGNAYWDLMAGKGDAGDPPTPFDETIVITGTGPVNLKSLAIAHTPAYDNAGDATVVYTVAGAITLTGNSGAANGGSGGHAVDTDTWPASTIDLTLENQGTIRAGGGGGGKGGDGIAASNGGSGGIGGDAIFCQEDIVIDNAPSGSGTIQAGGGGGGGGGGANYPASEPLEHGGGGGGGGFAASAGGIKGSGGVGAADGSAGTGSGGGSGGSGSGDAGNGGAGGNVNTVGTSGTSGTGSHQNGSGGGSGARGYAVRKNGNTVTATGGTITGTVG